MNDRISNFRTVELRINQSPGAEAEQWLARGIIVRKGVPHWDLIDRARFDRAVDISTAEGAVTALVRGSLALQSRWTLL